MNMHDNGPILMMECEGSRSQHLRTRRSRPCRRFQSIATRWSALLLLLLLATSTQQQRQERQQHAIDALATPSSIRRRSGKTTTRRSRSSNNGSTSDRTSSAGGNGFGKSNKNDADENAYASSMKEDKDEEDLSILPISSSSSPSPSSSTTPVSTSSSDTTTTRGGKEIYSLPALYDMAFGYRNYDEEVEFLFDQHSILQLQQQQQTQTQNDDATSKSAAFFPRRVLELAAGPARHSLEALMIMDSENLLSPSSDGEEEEEGGQVTAVDISSSMKEYGLELASTELDVDTQQRFDYRLGDITDFDLFGLKEEQNDSDPSTTLLYDTAWLLLGSLQHLTTNDDVIKCFQCVNRHLRPGGTFVLELPHPRELFSLVECTRNGWEIPLEDEDGETSGELKIVWGDDHDEFDPVTQVRQFTVAMELTGPPEEDDDDDDDDEQKAKKEPKDKTVVLQSVKEIVPMRHFTTQEIDCLAKLSGFELKAKFGALDNDVSIDSDDEAFRLVCILQKPY